MKSKFIVDVLLVVFVSVISSLLTYEFYVKAEISEQIPKVAIVSMDHEIAKLGIELNPEDYQEIAQQLVVKAEKLSEQGYIVLDNASVVSASDKYKAH